MQKRRVIIPLYIEMDERSSAFKDDVRTWDLTRMFGAAEGERFYFPEEAIEDQTVTVDE
jgi:hypothetical protein